MTDKEAVANEQLSICRLINAGNQRGDGGYEIINFSRENRRISGSFQKMSFSDSLLFEGGLLDVLRKL